MVPYFFIWQYILESKIEKKLFYGIMIPHLSVTSGFNNFSLDVTTNIVTWRFIEKLRWGK